MHRILAAGSLAYDRIMDYAGVFTEHILPDKLHTLSVSFQVPDITEYFGGTAGNVAYNLALLGGRADVLATVGRDFDRYEAHLHERGVSTATIKRAEGFTSAAHIITDRANNQIAAFALAAGGTPHDALPPLSEYRAAILSAGCVADSVALARECKRAQLPYYADPGQAIPAFSGEGLRETLDGATGLFCNDYELSLITEKTGWSEADLLARVPLIVVTLGAKGAEIRTKDERIEVPAAPIEKLVDPTGAGDAHRAGFLTGLIAGLPLETCGRVAAVAAAYAIERVGTQNHSYARTEFAARYEKAWGEPLTLSS